MRSVPLFFVRPLCTQTPFLQAHANKVPFARANSSQRVHSREHLTLTNKRQAAAPPQYHQQPTRVPNGKAFRIASPSEEGDDDDDEWVSSESGPATPNHRNSDSSDTASEADGPDQAILNAQIPQAQPRPAAQAQAQLQAQQQHPPARPDALPNRVPTARQTDFEALQRLERTNTARPSTPPSRALNQPHAAAAPPMPPQHPRQASPSEAEPQNQNDAASHLRQNANANSNSHKRRSRPPSTHSSQSKAEHVLRPHPLIRGVSQGHINVVPKQPPLTPLTVVPSAAPPQISTSPPDSEHDGGSRHHLSSSPTSFKTSSGSPISTDLPHSPYPLDRRTSFSSTRSVNTVPVHSTIIREMPRAHDRTRTLSKIGRAHV